MIDHAFEGNSVDRLKRRRNGNEGDRQRKGDPTPRGGLSYLKFQGECDQRQREQNDANELRQMRPYPIPVERIFGEGGCRIVRVRPHRMQRGTDKQRRRTQ